MLSWKAFQNCPLFNLELTFLTRKCRQHFQTTQDQAFLLLLMKTRGREKDFNFSSWTFVSATGHSFWNQKFMCHVHDGNSLSSLLNSPLWLKIYIYKTLVQRWHLIWQIGMAIKINICFPFSWKKQQCGFWDWKSLLSDPNFKSPNKKKDIYCYHHAPCLSIRASVIVTLKEGDFSLVTLVLSSKILPIAQTIVLLFYVMW